jgi:hypothetical protein
MKRRNLRGAVKTTYAFSAFLTPFPSNFHFAWYQQAGEGGSYDTLAEHYGERICCFTLALTYGRKKFYRTGPWSIFMKESGSSNRRIFFRFLRETIKRRNGKNAESCYNTYDRFYKYFGKIFTLPCTKLEGAINHAT